MELKNNDTIKDILAKLVGKDKVISIILKSGKNYDGEIQSFGEFCISLKQSGNKSYFDAFIRIEDILKLIQSFIQTHD